MTELFQFQYNTESSDFRTSVRDVMVSPYKTQYPTGNGTDVVKNESF